MNSNKTTHKRSLEISKAEDHTLEISSEELSPVSKTLFQNDLNKYKGDQNAY